MDTRGTDGSDIGDKLTFAKTLVDASKRTVPHHHLETAIYLLMDALANLSEHDVMRMTVQSHLCSAYTFRFTLWRCLAELGRYIPLVVDLAKRSVDEDQNRTISNSLSSLEVEGQVSLAADIIRSCRASIDPHPMEEALTLYNEILGNLCASTKSTTLHRVKWRLDLAEAKLLSYHNGDRADPLGHINFILSTLQAAFHDINRDKSNDLPRVPLLFQTHLLLCAASWERFLCTGMIEVLSDSAFFYQEGQDIFKKTTPPSWAASQTADLDALPSIISAIRHHLEPSHPVQCEYMPHRLYYGRIHLSVALTRLLEERGDLGALQDAIALHEDNLRSTPPFHPLRAMSLVALSESFIHRFQHLRSQTDIEVAISYSQEAIDLIPDNSLLLPVVLECLSVAFRERFISKGDKSDLLGAIAASRRALDVMNTGSCGEDHPDLYSSQLVGLANSLLMLHHINMTEKSLVESISLYERSLHLRPVPHPKRPESLHAIADAWEARYQFHRDPSCLDKSIEYHREAIQLLPSNKPTFYFMFISSMASTLALSSEGNGEEGRDVPRLKEAIAMFRQALEVAPSNHPHRSAIRLGMGQALSKLIQWNVANGTYEAGERDEALKELFDIFTLAANDPHTPSFLRFEVCKDWGRAARHLGSPTVALEAHTLAMGLFPSLASLDLTLQQRSNVLAHAGQIGTSAAANAIELYMLEEAVVFLEANRAVFWMQAMKPYERMDELGTAHPSISQRLRTIDKVLGEAQANRPSDSTRSREGEYYGELHAERERLIREIRLSPGFDHLKDHLRFEDLQGATKGGPVVMLASDPVTKSCYALILIPSGIKHLVLPIQLDELLKFIDALDLIIKDVPVDVKALLQMPIQPTSSLHKHREDRSDVNNANDTMNRKVMPKPPMGAPPHPPSQLERDNEAFSTILEAIWVSIVWPIVNALNLSKTTESNIPPRIWWCPIGFFAPIPIHAAGMYSGSTPECLSDYAVSSYCCSLQDLSRNYPDESLPKSTLDVALKYDLVAVIEPTSLPMAREELQRIHSHFHIPSPHRGSVVSYIGDSEHITPITQILEQVSNAFIVHLGCHGRSLSTDPLKSYLQLSGGKLSIADLVQSRARGGRSGKGVREMSIAFLSACSTAMGGLDTHDESLHLVAAMHFAGFQSVVGTLWEIRDDDAPDVTETFYKHLFRNSASSLPDVRESAYALHLSVQKMRKEGKGFRRWVPYAHFGV